MTGYAAAKFVNAALKAAGLDKAIPPQMMYNYARKGYITLTPEGVTAWTAAYLAKQGVELAPADPEQAEFDRSEAV